MKFDDFEEIDPSSIPMPVNFKGRVNLDILSKVEEAGPGKAYVLECEDLCEAVKKAGSLSGTLNKRHDKGEYLSIKIFRRKNRIYLVNDEEKWRLLQ